MDKVNKTVISEKVIDEDNPDLKEYTLQSDKLIVKIISLGATITNVIYQKDNVDVVLGYPNSKDYFSNDHYFGSTIGRVANRIREGKFNINNRSYELEVNDYENALHGGSQGFHTKIFSAKLCKDAVEFTYKSNDNECGFPGMLILKVIFSLIEDELSIKYEAISDKDTIVNFTNHTYFALQGQGNGNILNQKLRANADYYGEVDASRLVTGKLLSVKNSAFDFTNSKEIGKDIQDLDNKQIIYCDGYDHYFQFEDSENKQVYLSCKKSKKELIIETDMPGFHFYVPNFNQTIKGKMGKTYIGRCACCVETSFMPDEINHNKNPKTLLKKDKLFESTTKYIFK